METAPGCETPLISKRYVVALDWASTEPRFSVFVDGDRSEPGAASGSASSREILLDRDRPGPVLVGVTLDATEVPTAGDLTGTVVVSDYSGEPIPIAYCGAEFAVGLENDAVDQQPACFLCRKEGEIAPGVSTFDVNVLTTYGSSTRADPGAPPPTAQACLPGGGVPPLPPASTGPASTHPKGSSPMPRPSPSH